MPETYNHKDVSPEILQAIGYIAIVAGNIEHYLEDTILVIRNEPVAGVRPSTDLVPVSKLINQFKIQVNEFSSSTLKQIGQYWCEIASQAFICRNAILHGRSMVWNIENLDFLTNTRYNQEVRKRSSQTFIATVDTAKLLAEVFSLLAQTITGFMLLGHRKISEEQLIKTISLKKLREAISTINELVNLVEYYNNEKY